ncbi:MAG TPA: diaminopimelate epimerase [Terracidiphilus sp.]|nr:diaminopimelate epimerase [Terracidiphilus sp.]
MIPFTKAHACGNDFLIVTEEAAAGHDRAELTRRLCARNTGIGADGIEFFVWTGPRTGRIRLHNADGSIAEISGNGTRCVAAWMAEACGAQAGDSLEIATDAGMRVCYVNAVQTENGFAVDVTTAMGVPAFVPRTVTIPGGVQVEGVEVSTGNPHFVILVDNPHFTVDGQRWQSIGQQICGHPDFPHQTNVEFVRILSGNEIEIRIFERGVGPTTSSGTGTSASATAAIALHGCTSPLRVIAPGGAQTIEWNGPGSELKLTGPAALIALGEAW